MLVQRIRLLYGVAAMSAGVIVFAYLQEREEKEDQEQALAERVVKPENFFDAIEEMQLTTQQRLEMRRFWRNLCKKQQRQLSRTRSGRLLLSSNSDTTSSTSAQDTSPRIIVGDIQQFAQEYKKVFPDIFPEQQVLDAAERAAATSAWNGFVGSTSTMIMSTGKRLNDIAKDTKGEVQQAMHRTVRHYLERALDVVAEKLKNALKDPHMPSYLKTNIDIAIEQFMPDVKMEIFRKMRDLFRQDSTPSIAKGMIKAPIPTKKLSLFGRIRGHILYHIFPHDKSIWMSFKDPWWILFTCIGILPVVGQLWWLFLFLIKDKTNEHQLCQFIIGFKAAQFITLGIFYTLLGIISYVKCIARGSMADCQDGGPMLETRNAFFFILQIALVWIAFFRLPYTERPTERRHTLLYRTASMERRENKVFHDVFGNELHLNRGGYLMKFAGYETVTFIIVMMLACMVVWLPLELWQRKALFYWIRTVYGLFSFPYLAFKIPLLANVLMHTRRMGYNQRGDTVKTIISKSSEFS